MSNISLRQLRYFDALARSLHFGRAAEQCAVTQPALSMQIQELEKELGTVLIERTRTGTTLTREGEEVARRVSLVLASVRDLTDYARHSARALTGPLRLGVIPTIAPYVLPKLLPKLRAAYPELDLHLREAQTQYVLADLAGGRLDAVLLSLPIDEPEIETQELFDDAFVLAMPASRPIPEKTLATPKLFENERLLLLEEGHCLRDQALAFCSLKQVQNLNTFGTTSLSTLVQMVANSFGVTLLPEMSLETEANRGDIRLFPFAEPKPLRKIGLAWRQSSPRKHDFTELGATIRALAKEFRPKADADRSSSQ
jgi:LysR family transcriptional regulator, hydrogen peroxide-inducible genes activator